MDFAGEIKKIKNTKPSEASFKKMSGLISEMIVQASVNWAGKLYNHPKFIRLAGLRAKDQTEQDRILNELVIAPLTLLMITLEAPDIDQPRDYREFLKMIRDEIPKAHIRYLKSLGIEKKYLRLWEKLIKMRYEEYKGERVKARQAMMEYESGLGELTISELDGINKVVPAFLVAVGCHQHICRGKGLKNEALFKMIMKKLSRFYVEYRVMVEGGKITLDKKIRMKFSHLTRDVKESLGFKD